MKKTDALKLFEKLVNLDEEVRPCEGPKAGVLMLDKRLLAIADRHSSAKQEEEAQKRKKDEKTTPA